MNIEIISRIWNIIVESNTFNFIIFLSLFALLFKKINLKGIINSLPEKTVKILDDVEKEKEIALNLLKSAESEIANLDNELKEIVVDAEKSAEVIGHKIMSEAQKQLENIESNAIKVIEAEEKLLVSQLSKKVSQESIKTAKSHIQQTLVQTPSLHEKFINESIDELDRLNF